MIEDVPVAQWWLAAGLLIVTLVAAAAFAVLLSTCWILATRTVAWAD